MALTLRVLILLGVVIAVLFGSAGRWDLPFFWGLLGVVVVFLLSFRLLTLSHSNRLIEQGLLPGPGANANSIVFTAYLWVLKVSAWTEQPEFRELEDWSFIRAQEVFGARK